MSTVGKGMAVLALPLLLLTFFPTQGQAQEPDAPVQPDEGDAPEGVGDDESDETGGLRGTLRSGGEPLEAVTITVLDEAGAQVASTETGEDGRWEVLDLPVGIYTVVLDEATLPDGVVLEDDQSAEKEAEIRQAGWMAGVGFSLAGEDDDQEAERGQRALSKRISQALANGLKFGLLIGIASIGLSLIFGATGLINFSHGELVTFGAVTGWFLNTEAVDIGLLSPNIHIGPLDVGELLPIVVAVALAMLIGALFGGGLELGVFRPLRGRGTGPFQLLVITIGLSLAMRQALLIWFGERPRRYALGLQSTIGLGPVTVTPRDLIIMGLSLVVLLAIGSTMQFTRIGKAMRAVSDNSDLAESSGIDVQRVILLVWMLGAGLAALGGSFFGIVTNVQHDMGFDILLLMFGAVILGGLGTAFGAVAGGLVIGVVTELSTVWAPSEIKYVWALAVLMLVLLIRPQGIFGVRERVG